MILVIDDDRAFRVATQTLLQDAGYDVTLAVNGEEGLSLLRSAEFELILSDMVMGNMDGIEFLRRAKEVKPEIPVLMVTGFGSIQTAVEAMRLGAMDYLTKPCNNDELLIKVARALEARRKESELRHLREEVQGIYSFGNIITRSEKMHEVLRLVQQVADTDVTVLIEGESGTGKELVARALHFNSNRKNQPFVAVNCSALPENLLESELFGYEKGAFTGAEKRRIGKFEEAHGGTIFLDEVGDMPMAVQTKLLRVLQDKTFTRIGGNASITADARVVAATNRDLSTMMQTGDFREDLYYRLNVFPLTLPPLRERIEDIPLLAEHIAEKNAHLSGGAVKSISPSVMNDMMNYTWRGNIRELQNLIKRAIIKTPGDVITNVELPGSVPAPGKPDAAIPPVSPSVPFKEYLGAIVHDAEEKYLRKMLRLYNGNVNQIAKLMEIDRKTVYRKMDEYSIDPSSYRDKTVAG